MTAVVTAASGYDLGYVWKNQAEKDPAKDAEREQAKDRASYYEQKGEPAGRWFGKGAEALGFAKGQEVEHEPYTKMYSQIHPQTGEQLGRKPSGKDKYDELLNRMKAAEPHATAERIHEMQRIAHQESRRSAPYTDVTVSLVKSVSIFHASHQGERAAGTPGRVNAEADGDRRRAAHPRPPPAGGPTVTWSSRRLCRPPTGPPCSTCRTGRRPGTGSGVARVNGEDTVQIRADRPGGVSPGCRAPAGTVTRRTTSTTRLRGCRGPTQTASGARSTPQACARNSAQSARSSARTCAAS